MERISQSLGDHNPLLPEILPETGISEDNPLMMKNQIQ